MNVIKYKNGRFGYECEEISWGACEKITEFRFHSSVSGSLRLKELHKKFSGSVCRINTEELKDGIYSPELYLSGKRYALESFEIKGGKAYLIPKNDEYVRMLSAELELLFKELEKIKKTLSLHDEKINGNPIF